MTRRIEYGGQVHEFPDGTSDAEITGALNQLPPQQSVRSRMGPAEDVARTALPALARGGARLLGTPGDIVNLVRGGSEAIGRQVFDPILDRLTGTQSTPEQQRQRATMYGSRMAGTPEVIQGIEALVGRMHQPETPIGQMAGATIEGGVGAMAGPLRNAATAFGLGALGGSGDQTVRQLAPGSDTAQTLAPMAGFATSMGPAALMARSGAAGNAVAQRMSGITEADTAQAQALTRRAQAEGITPFTPGEAYGTAAPGLRQLEGNVAASPVGGQLRRALEERYTPIMQSVQRPGGMLERISPDATPQDAARIRTGATHQLYEKANSQTLDPAGLNLLGPLDARIDAMIAEVGASSDIGKQLLAYQRRLRTPEAGEPAMRVGPLSTLQQETARGVPPAETTDPGIVRRMSGYFGQINPELRQVLEQNNPAFGAAQDRFRQLSPRVEAADFRERLAEALSRAAGRGGAGQLLNPQVGGQFALAARGRPMTQRAGEFNQAVEGAATARGMNPDVLQRDIGQQMDVLARTSLIPGIGSETGPRGQLGGQLRRSPAAAVMEGATPSNLLFGPMAARMRERAEMRNYSKLAEALQAPDAIEQLRQMARAPGVSRRDAALASQLMQALQAPQQMGAGQP